MSAELVKSGPTPGELLQRALDVGATPESLEKLLAVHERWQATQARTAFVRAMSAFKANPPKIIKDKKVDTGRVHYAHASLANIVREVTPALAVHGLSCAWTTSQDSKEVVVTCTITHEGGHCESASLCAPPDTSGTKNPVQQVGSTVTYLQRYTMLTVLGLATEDMDDADQPGPAFAADGPTDAQLDRLRQYASDESLPEATRAYLTEKLAGNLTAKAAGALIRRIEEKLAEKSTEAKAANAPDGDRDPGEDG